MKTSICEIVDSLGLDLTEYYNRYAGACPVHGGDNPNGFCIYKETGIWQCFTNSCHERFGCSLNSLLKLLGRNPAIELPQIKNEINNIYLERESKNITPIPRDRVRSSLKYPATYFIQRGFSEETLDRYDVGVCTTRGKRMYQRCVVPIYEQTRHFMVGCTGRSINNEEPKWLHNRLARNNTLYNLWFATSYIKKYKTIILVEGPGDVWKLEDAGIHCGLAILGSSLSAGQMSLMSQTGAMSAVLLLDNDEAGKKATSNIVKQLKNLYNIEVPSIGNFNDVGDMPANAIEDLIKPLLERLVYD